MYENTPGKILEWVTAVPGQIPDQAVVFEERSENDAMYVVNVIDGSENEGGLYETDKPCAEYLDFNFFRANVPKCMQTFEFLVLREGECGSKLAIIIRTFC